MEQTSLEQFGLRFLHGMVCKNGRALVNSELETIGLHLGQDVILKMLWDEDGQTQSELAEKIRISGATLTRALQRMESSNLIERRPCTGDARVMRVYVAEAGHKLKPQVEAIWHKVEETLFAGLTTDERILFQRLLMQVYTNLLEVE